MSSSRKRSAIKKANEHADYLNQKLMRTEHQLSLMETFAKLAAIKHDEKQLEVYELRLKYCPETMTDKDHINYKAGKQKLEDLKKQTQGVTNETPSLVNSIC